MRSKGDEQIITLVSSMGEKLDTHIQSQAEHNANQRVTEEKIAKAIEVMSSMQDGLTKVVDGYHNLNMKVATDMATKSEVVRVHERVDKVVREMAEVEVTANSNANIINGVKAFVIKYLPWLLAMAAIGTFITVSKTVDEVSQHEIHIRGEEQR